MNLDLESHVPGIDGLIKDAIELDYGKCSVFEGLKVKFDFSFS